MTLIDEAGGSARSNGSAVCAADVIEKILFYPEPENPAGLSCQELDDQIEAIGAEAFGPGRFARAAFRLREARAPEQTLSFTAWLNCQLVGSVRQTRIRIGDKQALVLGPLVVLPEYKNAGIGAKLMMMSVEASKAAGHGLIILVGDQPYYQRFGFKMVPYGRIALPGPADPARILYCELQEGALEGYSGAATRF